MRPLSPALRQQEFNRASRGSWNAFAEHRDHVAALLEQSVAPESRHSLCILGAGNCNDLDLPRLAAQWTRIRLVDLDVEAMRAGVSRQFHLRPPEHLELSACDVTGALEYCHDLLHSPTSSRESLTKLRQALAVLPAVERLGERFSCVVSTCLLSQLTTTMRYAVGDSSPDLWGLVQLVRLQHLRTLAELTQPGGVTLALIDFVSSESLPQLPDAPASALPGLMEQALAEGNFFSGMNPVAIQQLLHQPPLDSYWSEPPQAVLPWRWNLGPRSYLVTALVGHRA
jgi:hypothetical protein